MVVHAPSTTGPRIAFRVRTLRISSEQPPAPRRKAIIRPHRCRRGNADSTAGLRYGLGPHGSIKDMDISMRRPVAVRMALVGRHQKARDFAETAQLLASDEPRRARVAGSDRTRSTPRWWILARLSSGANRQTIAQGRPVQSAYLLRLKLVCFFILHARLWVRQST
jgi:hypothetical protein